MRFHKHKPPRTPAEWQQVLDRWRELGWVEISAEDESAIESAWKSKLELSGRLTIPRPSRTWKLPILSEEIESEFTLAILAAFRECTRPEERLLVIDWQHQWYSFNPHGRIRLATRDEWAVPILPDGDSNNFLALDYRFGIISGWQTEGPLSIFGEELLTAFEANPPLSFLKACGPGVTNHT